MVSSLVLLGALTAAASAAPSPSAKRAAGQISCPVVFSGQVSANATPADFDSASTSPFDPTYVRGSQPFSECLLLPAVANSRFDNASYRSVEATIDDESVFQGQEGFRRVGLQFADDSNTGGEGAVGVRTLHWSVRQDAARALNLSHEYLNVWHETSDYSANQFNFEMGTIIGTSSDDENTFKFLDRDNTQVWSTPIENATWQNFAITLDFDQNTIQIYYSEDDDALTNVTAPLSNDNSGGGQYQIGILKKPTDSTDVVNNGYQESGIDEGQIYGGLFLEDSANGCVSK
ncbi:hypothetical protein GGR56DRAFT_184492 [Xylariaceae sp. FL0804]|nr:hypothetical protein GGR56DRAFT_184492 [Xylariaceae sp. FL0804]